MATFKQEIKSYEDAERFLGDRVMRKLAHNTYVHREGQEIFVRYHNTNIVTYWPSGSIILNTGGWDTITTTQRMHALTPSNIFVNLSKGQTLVTVDENVTKVDTVLGIHQY